jgi:hypothetical protein
MAAKKGEQQTAICPVGKFFIDLESVFGKQSEFFKHMSQSRIEFLKAMRSLLDERINSLEKQGTTTSKKRMTKIKVG